LITSGWVITKYVGQLKKDKEDLLKSLYKITEDESPSDMYDLAVDDLHKYDKKENFKRMIDIKKLTLDYDELLLKMFNTLYTNTFRICNE